MSDVEQKKIDEMDLIRDVCAEVLNEIVTRIIVELIKIDVDGSDTITTSTYPAEENVVVVEKKNLRDERDSDSVSLDDFYYSGDDSDEEFERLVSYPMNKLRECHKKEYAPITNSKKKRRAAVGKIEHEYEKLPAVVRPEVHLSEDTSLMKIGSVFNHMDCLLVVKSENSLALDLDSYMFSKEKELIGMVYDVLGSPYCPLYCIRFNSAEDALKYPIGLEVYIAPNNEVATKLVLVSQLANMKITDSAHDVSGEDEFAFSDDEEERKFRQQLSTQDRGQSRKRHRGGVPRGGYWHQKGPRQENEIPNDLESFFSGGASTMSSWSVRQGEKHRGRGRGRWNGNWNGAHRGGGGQTNQYYPGSNHELMDSRYMGNQNKH